MEIERPNTAESARSRRDHCQIVLRVGGGGRNEIETDVISGQKDKITRSPLFCDVRIFSESSRFRDAASERIVSRILYILVVRLWVCTKEHFVTLLYLAVCLNSAT